VVRREGTPSDALVEAAIARVLEAERAARLAGEAAREQAAVSVREAHAWAQEIARRAERRIGRYRLVIDQRVGSEQRQIEAEIGALARAAGEDRDVVRRGADAVAILAAELSGGDRD
jgi:hypothetical protein